MLRHPWASRVLESRTNPTPTVLEVHGLDIGMFRAGGFSIDHRSRDAHEGKQDVRVHAELYDDSPQDPLQKVEAIVMQQMVERYPYISGFAAAITHDPESTVGLGCDDRFEFGLDLMLDGLERLRGVRRR